MQPLSESVLALAAKIDPSFRFWVGRNQALTARFLLEANKVWKRGRTHYSARTICEFIRHETALSDALSVYKINNNVVPKLARLYVAMHPSRKELFELRERGV